MSLSLSASDAHSGSYNWGEENLPVGLSINPTSGLITGTIATGAANDGAAYPLITVSDGGDAISAAFMWDVEPTLSLASIADQSDGEDMPVSLSLSASAPALIVFVIDDESYLSRYPKKDWAYLGKGLGVEIQDRERTLYHLDAPDEDLEPEASEIRQVDQGKRKTDFALPTRRFFLYDTHSRVRAPPMRPSGTPGAARGPVLYFAGPPDGTKIRCDRA